MRVGLVVTLVLTLVTALWFSSREPELESPSPAPAPPPAAVVSAAPFAASAPPAALPDERAEPSQEEDVEPSRRTSTPKCRPTFHGEGLPLELTLTGAALPPAPARALHLEVRWVEDGEPRQWFVALREWKSTFWLCDESEVAVRRGAYRLRAQRVPRAGAVSLFLGAAAAPSELAVRTERRGAAIGGVRLSLTGCEPVLTDDAGVALTSCEEVDAPRHAVVRAPWRIAKPLLVAVDATSVTVPVLGREEVEPGRVGLGFVPGSDVPVVGVIAEGGPAARAGVQLGDEVLEVDGLGVSTIDEATPRIIGAPGSTVRFKLRRGKVVLLVDVVRAPDA